MDFSTAHKYFAERGFDFEYDNSKSIYWSDCHVLWKGYEFGIMYRDQMMLRDGEGMCHFFSYNMGLYPNKEITDLVEKFLRNVDLKYRMYKDKMDRVKNIKDYFEKRKSEHAVNCA